MTDAVLPVLAEAALRSLAAAMVVWAALRIFRVRNVRTQKAAWTLVLVGALAMPLLMRWQWLPAGDAIQVPPLSQLSAPAISLMRTVARSAAPVSLPPPTEVAPPPPPSAWTFSPGVNRSTAYASSRALGKAALNLQHSPAVQPLETAPAPLGPDPVPPVSSAPWPAASHQTSAIQLLNLAWLLYLAVAAALLLRLIFGLIAALRLWMTAEPVLSPVLAELALSGSVRWSIRLKSPANLGSAIVLPSDYGEWSQEKLRAVLAHERVHVRQGDFYLQLFAGLYAALVWFSPLGWWLKRKLSELGEAMGDRAGLEQAASPSSYAQMLLEFAALPRPIRTGVAMARTGHLASRIERLLNDANFRQAFSGNRRRTVLVMIIAPLALIASAALVRVQAAGQAAALPQGGQAQILPAAQETGVSNPPEQTVTNQDQNDAAPTPAPPPAVSQDPASTPASGAPPAPAAVPAPAPAPDAAPGPAPAPGAAPPMPAAPGQQAMPPVPPVHVQIPPMPKVIVHIPPLPDINAEINRALHMQMDGMGRSFDAFSGHPYFFFASDGGEPWALVPGQGEPIINAHHFGPNHGGVRAEIDQARKTAHAPFFWFKHDGKAYIVEDPSVVAQVEALEKPIEDLRSQMRALGKQQRALGEQLRQKAREQRQAPVPKPDLSKQMADLNAAVESLKASQGNTITQDQLMKLQSQLAALQGKVASLESGFYTQNGQWGAAMGEFGRQMGKLGAEQGRLGGEMARISVDNRSKIDALIKQSLGDGKAKPVN